MTNNQDEQKQQPDWIRGVNIGGWLVLERFITPYMFAITDCHYKEPCWYPGQLSAPPGTQDHCDLTKCKAIQVENPTNKNILDYPWDEYSLQRAFQNHTAAGKRFLDAHYNHFITRKDVEKLVDAGVTHVRVPLPHWILWNQQDLVQGEPWIVDNNMWLYFVRLVSWCRHFGVQVWPDLHTAPGSQNGFDNSGYMRDPFTCKGWANSTTNVKRTLGALELIVKQIRKDGLDDVVTGFGLLNEPFPDCPTNVIRNFNTQALDIVKDTMGHDAHVYIHDMFNSTKWNLENEWAMSDQYRNVHLDSHYYQVFDNRPRALSPRQHIAYACEKNHRDMIACCYPNHQTDKAPAPGISRIAGEWSAAYDVLVVAMLGQVIMPGIYKNGTAPRFHRKLSPKRREFLQHFVQAQMVSFEAADKGVSSGWFYWTLKMEGGAFAEWDFLRGIEEGWIPRIPTTNVSSVDLYGTCEDIIFQVDDELDIIHQYPDPATLDPLAYQGVEIDDDVVLSHGDSLLPGYQPPPQPVQGGGGGSGLLPLLFFFGFAYAIKRVFIDRSPFDTRPAGYDAVDGDIEV